MMIDEALPTSLGQLLNFRSRCFGDKGDVEDITEGSIHLFRLDLQFTEAEISLL